MRLSSLITLSGWVRIYPAITKNEEATYALILGSRSVLINRGFSIVISGYILVNLIATISINYLTDDK